MSEEQNRYEKLNQCFFKYIGYLNKLAEDKDKPQEAGKRNVRAILARFRESLRNDSPLEILKYLQEHFDELPGELSFYERQKIEDNYILIAGLVGLHPESSHHLKDKYSNLGSSLAEYDRKINNDRPKSSDDPVSSTEKRFMALLKAKEEDLPKHLRQIIQLLGAKDISVNWFQLLKDINDWNNEKINVRRNWARGFWGTTKNKEKGEEKQ